MSYADSLLRDCWIKWRRQPLYSRILTCWAVPLIPFAVIIDLAIIISEV